MSAALRRSLASLELPNYRRWFTGMVISISGNWMQTVAEMWLILKLTNSGTAVGLTAALQFLPMLLVGAWGGLLADRLPKRRLLVVTQTMMAVPALALFALTLSGVPFMGPIGAVRVSFVDGAYVLNPAVDDMEKLRDNPEQRLDLIVAGTKDAVMMVESEAKELSEDQMLGAVMFAHRASQKVIEAIIDLAEQAAKDPWELAPAIDTAATTTGTSRSALGPMVGRTPP